MPEGAIYEALRAPLEEIDQVLGSKVGQHLDAVFSDTIDTEEPLPRSPTPGRRPEANRHFRRVLGDVGNGGHVMDLVEPGVLPHEQRGLMPAPVPGHKLVRGCAGSAGKDIGQPRQRLDALHSGHGVRLDIVAACRPPRSAVRCL